MSPVFVTWRRTLGRAAGLYTTAFAVGGFLAVSGGAFAFGLARAEGGVMPLAAVWSGALSPILPVLAALLAMGTWSDERQSGRMEELLSVAVRERDYVLGKFLGVWTALVAAVLMSLAVVVAALCVFAPSALAASGILSFVPAVFVLAVQGLLWTAVSEAASAALGRAAAAAAASVALVVVLPRALWRALLSWSPRGAAAFGEMPLDAHAVDWATGSVSVGALAVYVVLTAMFLLVATKCVAASRLVGRGARAARASTAAVIVLAFVFAALAVRLAMHFDFAVELPRVGLSSGLSVRTRAILADTFGEVSAVCFLPRGDARFRPLGHLLRAFAGASAASGGARIDVRYVDPRWDVAAAERLAAAGVAEASVVFKSGRRTVVLPLKDGFGERACASAIRRLSAPPPRRVVYWTTGHGEASTDGYGLYGLSDFAREVVRDGYRNSRVDLAAAAVPADGALVVASGPREAFARVELDRLDSYLRAGGRLLVMVDPSDGGGLATLLSSWGMKPVAASLPDAKTLSGSDVVVSDLSDHPIAAPLRGSRIVLERPAAFEPSAAAAAGRGVDRIGFSPLASVGQEVVAAAVERGSMAGGDLAVRPTRIVAIGDATFALNGSLSSRANANLDFLLNSVAYLAGAEVSAAGGAEAGVLVTGLDRAARVRFAAFVAGVVPAAAFLALAGVVLRRRLRT